MSSLLDRVSGRLPFTSFRRQVAVLAVALGAALLPVAAMASTGCAALNLSGHTTGSGTAVGPSPAGTYATGDVVAYTITSFSGGSGYQQLNTQSASAVTGHNGGTGTYYYSIPSAGSYQFTAVDGSPAANGGSEQIYFTLSCNSAPVPTVTSISPTSGYTNGAASVVITGTNFSVATPSFAVNSVKFGNVAASFTINSSTQITAIAPTVTSAQTVDVTVSNVGYTSATSASDRFTYTGPAPIPNCLPYDTTANVAEVIDFSSVGNSATLTKSFNSSSSGHASNCETQDYGLYTAAQNGGATTVPSDGYSDANDTMAATTTITGAGGSSITLTGTNNASPNGYDYDLLTVKVANTNGLTSDTYTVYVSTNGSTVNSSIKFVVNFAVNATVPGAPTIGTATAGNSQATVTFTAPASNGGSAITSYTVTSSPGGLTAAGSGSPLTVSGLINGTAYTFTVKATNSVGSSAASSASNSVTPATFPGVPTIGTATAGNASASVTFTAPASNGGSAITSYTVTSSPGGLTATGSGSPLTVSGLTNGTAYTFTVKATNSLGASAASAASNSVTPAGVPGAPTIGSVTAGNASASVTFTAPSANGSAITSYTVTSSPGGITASGTGSPITVSGLTNGTPYTFTVTATNSVGTGPASAASATVTPATVPGAPTVGTATAGNASASVAFAAPASNGGAAINSYTAISSPSGFSASGTTSPITVSGLSNGTAYTFTVYATNSVGNGPASAASNSVTPLVPGVSATPGSGGAATAPTTNVGTAAAQTAVSFNVTNTGALGTPQVLTLGTPNLDFTLGTGSTCTGSATGSCVVNVAFTPQAPGVRMGAVNLINAAGAVIATAYISGTGTGPLATLSPGLVSTVAGNGTSTYVASQDMGTTPATATEVAQPTGVAVDGAGNLYVAEVGNARVRKIAANTGYISTVAGNGTSGYVASQDNGTTAATAAELNGPFGLAIDGAGNLYIADTSNSRIRKVTAATGYISTVAGNGTSGYVASQDTGTTAATAAEIAKPLALVVDGAGDLYFADQTNQRIRKVTAATGFISTVAGNGTAGYVASQDTGTTAATAAEINGPYGVAVDAAGNIFIADTSNNRVRKVTASTGFISTVAGNGTAGYVASQDTGTTTALAAELNFPVELVLDAAGNLYISDGGNARYRKVSAATGYISTIAGNGSQNYSASTDTGTTVATSAGIYWSSGMAIDSAGNLYLPDVSNRVRKVSVTSDIVFPTATAAGTGDATDGTKTATVNNIGNLPLVFTSQVETGSSFVLGNPMTGGCVSNGTVAAGGSCLIGATFAPVAGSTGNVGGYVTLTDNSLNVSGTTQTVLLEGTTTAGVVTVVVPNITAATGATTATLQFLYSYSGTAGDLGSVTVTVNGATAAGTPVCKNKAGHVNCTLAYNPSALALGNYPISVMIAADAADGYLAGSGSGTLSITTTGMAGLNPGFGAVRAVGVAPPVTAVAAPVSAAMVGSLLPSPDVSASPVSADIDAAPGVCTDEAQAAAVKRGNAACSK